MKKMFLALMFIVGLSSFVMAGNGDQPTQGYYLDGLTSVASSGPTISSACTGGGYLNYCIIETTGTIANRTITIRDALTTLFTYTIPKGTTALTQVMDFSRAPIRFSTSLQYYINLGDNGVAIFFGYQRF